MARIRTIKPQFWTDETVGKLSLGARLLFIATWNLADDEGILIWNVSYLRGQVFPYDRRLSFTKVEQMMGELVSHKFIEAYDVGADKYAFIKSFARHQTISKPLPSTKPIPHSPDFVSRYTRNSSSPPVLLQDKSRGEYGTGTGIRNTELEGNGKEGAIASSDKTSSSDNDNSESLKKDGEQSPELAAVIDAFGRCGGVVSSQMIAQELADAEREYGSQIIIAGFRRASRSGKSGVRLLAYCRPIWEDFKANGIKEEHGAHQKRSNLSRKYTDPDEWLRKQREIAAGDEPTSEPGE